MRGTTPFVIASLLLAGLSVPGAAAAPEPPECYDRQPIVDAGVVRVWLTRSCTFRVEVDEDAVAVAVPDVPDLPHKDVYAPKHNCPIGWSGTYERSALDTPVLTVWTWRCTPYPPV